jgi:hypothetical protein
MCCGTNYPCEHVPYLRLIVPAIGLALFLVGGTFFVMAAIAVLFLSCCIPKQKHIGTDRLLIEGATGPNAETINGIYEPTEELIECATVYHKVGDKATCMKLENKLCGLQWVWIVTAYESSDKPEYAASCGMPGCAFPGPCLPNQCVSWELTGLPEVTPPPEGTPPTPPPTLTVTVTTLERLTELEKSEQGEQLPVLAVEPMHDASRVYVDDTPPVITAVVPVHGTSKVYIDDTPVVTATPVVVAGPVHAPGPAPVQQLPVGWIEQRDPANGRPFFVYTPTGLTQWDPPAVYAPPQ